MNKTSSNFIYLVTKGKNPNDGKGTHANRGNTLPINVDSKTHQHIHNPKENYWK